VGGGKLSGLCKRTYSDGCTLEGELREGRQWNARCVLKHPAGTVEEGEWIQGKLTGQCTGTFRDDRVEHGTFRNGRPAVTASEDSKGGAVTKKNGSTVVDNATSNTNGRGRAITETERPGVQTI
jgi:hypothetical protein